MGHMHHDLEIKSSIAHAHLLHVVPVKLLELKEVSICISLTAMPKASCIMNAPSSSDQYITVNTIDHKSTTSSSSLMTPRNHQH